MSGNSVSATRVLIAINGSPIGGLLHATIQSSNCFSADKYALAFAMGAPPLGDINFWSSMATGYVEVAVSEVFGMTSLKLITGMIDAVVIDPINGTVGIDGRDLSASLIDSYRQESFVNQTASEVVSTVARNHDLLPVVSPTTLTVGRYYGDGYTRLSLGDFSRLRSDWDLVVELAR
jgi:prophage tail gpP-like protein